MVSEWTWWDQWKFLDLDTIVNAIRAEYCFGSNLKELQRSTNRKFASWNRAGKRLKATLWDPITVVREGGRGWHQQRTMRFQTSLLRTVNRDVKACAIMARNKNSLNTVHRDEDRRRRNSFLKTMPKVHGVSKAIATSRKLRGLKRITNVAQIHVRDNQVLGNLSFQYLTSKMPLQMS